MAKYLIGDIHGCAANFVELLHEVDFNPSKDELFLAGDLVGRGPEAKKVIDLAIKHDAKAVIGNYDCQLLACIAGACKAAPADVFDEILVLDKKKQNYYFHWFLEQGFVRDEEGFYLVHAALDPSWDHQTILDRAQRAKDIIQKWSIADFQHYFGAKRFNQNFYEMDYLNEVDLATRNLFEDLILFVLCRFRQLKQPQDKSVLFPPSPKLLLNDFALSEFREREFSGMVKDLTLPYWDLELSNKGLPIANPEQGLYPWYNWEKMLYEQKQLHLEWFVDNPNLDYQGFTKPVYFGHWTRLNGIELPPGYICSDTSCVFGDSLTIYQLPEQALSPRDPNNHAALKRLAQPIVSSKYAYTE